MTNNNKPLFNKNEATLKSQTGTTEGIHKENNNEEYPNKLLEKSDNSRIKYAEDECHIKEGELLIARILSEGAELPVDMKQPFLLPAWFDKTKFQRGQRYFKQNYFALFVGKLSGLLAILAVPSILRVLILTKKSSEPLTAFRRYVDTISHMVDWYHGDICNPNSKCRKSLLSIRGRHCGAERLAVSSGYGPITQCDMAVTQFGFMGFPLIAQEKLGLHGSNEDLEGFIHFWRVIGHLLGINDQFNLCRGNIESTKAACRGILREVLSPSFNCPIKEFQPMAKALLDGMWALVPAIQAEAFMDFTRDLCGLPQSQETRTLYSRIILKLQIFVHSVLLYYQLLAIIFRPIFNFQMWLSVFITQRFPFLAFMAFGRNVCSPEPQFSLQPTLLSAT
ncbi:rubber oxygenase-like [Lycorma delicatula]|uniref:rubber oxygenase-like n=1 Tax=Lycorma delicatula TaxID=130591 RepID=UPI003F51895F